MTGLEIIYSLWLITTRKRSLRRLCFCTCLSVILFTGGGGSASVHAGIADAPPGADPLEQTPTPRSRHLPCTVHDGRYGQQAGGTHPTGMHTCLWILHTKIPREPWEISGHYLITNTGFLEKKKLAMFGTTSARKRFIMQILKTDKRFIICSAGFHFSWCLEFKYQIYFHI